MDNCEVVIEIFLKTEKDKAAAAASKVEDAVQK